MTRSVVVALALVALSSWIACGPATSSKVPVAAPPEELVSRPPATPDVLQGERLLVKGRVSEAQELFERAIADDPEDARAWLDLGLTQEAKRDPASAERAYRRAIEIDPQFAEALNNLGVLLREGGHLPEATSVLERAASLDPTLTAARFNLGLSYEEQRRFDDAEREYLATIEQLPADPIPRVNLAMMYLDAGRPEDAAAQLRAVRPTVRGDVLLSIAVGQGLRRAGAPAEAVAVLEDARAQAGDPLPTDLLAELALAYYAAGDLSSAEKTMRRAIDQNEVDPALQYAYGSILARMGEVGRARTHFRRAISLDADGPYAERSRMRLEALK